MPITWQSSCPNSGPHGADASIDTARHQADFNWTEDLENVLRELKRLVITAPVLRYYDAKAGLEIRRPERLPAPWKEVDRLHI